MKRKLLFGLGLLFALTSCGHAGSTSQGGDSASINLGYQAQDIVDTLNAISSGGNYTLQYEYSGRTYYEYYTEDYGFFEATGNGYVGIDDYSGSGEKLFYKLLVQHNDIDLYQTLTYFDSESNEYLPIRSTDHLDYMRLISSEASFDASDFTVHQTGFYTDNADIILILANLMGYADSANLISVITFSLLDDGAMKFKFSPNFQEGYEVIDGVEGIFTNIGSTSYELLENFVETYELPENMLSDQALSFLNQDVISINSNITRIYRNQPIQQIQRTELDYSSTGIYIESYYSDLEYPVKNLYFKNDEGVAELTYVDTSNHVSRISTGNQFDEMFVSPKTFFERRAFRADDSSSTYEYYGYQASKLIESFSNYTLGITESMEITVKDNAITKIVAKTPEYSMSGSIFYTQAEITIESARELPTISSLTPTKDDDKIQTILNMFNDEARFSAEIITNGDTTHSSKVTVADDIMLVAQKGYDTDMGGDSAIIETYSGYQVSNYGAVPFKVSMTEDEGNSLSGVAKASDDTILDVTMKDMIGFVASSSVFELDDSNKLVFRETVDNVGSGVFAGSYSDYIVTSSFEMELDATGVPYSISYDYSMDDGFYVGHEEILFTDWGVATLPENIDFSNIGLWSKPTSWKEELKEADYAELVNTFGQEYTDQIPYLFAKELLGSWQINNTSAGIGGGAAFLHIFSVDIDTPNGVDETFYPNYALKYAELLEDLGYVRKVKSDWGGLEVFELGDVNIRITYNEGQVDLFIIEELVANYSKGE